MTAFWVLRVFALLGAFTGWAVALAAQAGGVQHASPSITVPSFWSGRVETANGFDVTGSSWSVYSTAILSPFGPADADGVRLKLYGSYGTWSYDTKRVYCALSPEEKKRAAGIDLSAACDDLTNGQLSSEDRDHIARTAAPFGLQLDGDQLYLLQQHQVGRYELAALPGYQASFGRATLKAYLGPALETRTIMPPDAEKALPGTSWGAKSVVESWMTLSPSAWLSADGSYFTGTEAYSAAMRLGYRPLSWLTLGPEMAAFGDREDDSARTGGFLRFNIGKTETTLSGGVSADYDGDMSPYGSVGMYVKF